ncbi:MAG: protein kinase [archaeon]|nr:protein kinase [archaeon]
MKPANKIQFSKENFICARNGSINDSYTIEKELGTGTYGTVSRIKNKITGETYACKKLVKSMIADHDKFTNEINIMTKADHPNIIKLYEIYEDDRHLYLVMEECKGGELFDRIVSKADCGKLYTEKQAASIFKQVMYAISYCHNKKICHRDIKAENILFLGEEDDSPIKVIDFGLSRIFGEKETEMHMTSKVGTAYYVSPEVLKGNYDEKCDVWACGVLLYILLSGIPPFNGSTDNAIYRAITKKKFSFPEEEWGYISKDAKDLICKMICDPEKRLTAQQVLEHPWITQLAPNASDSLQGLNVKNMRKYKKRNKIQRAIISYIASRLNDSDVSKLKECFTALDENKDGSLTLEELEKGIKNSGLDFDISSIFKALDTDKSGKIDYTEFLACCIDKKTYLTAERLNEAFKMLDLDGSGKISKEEIKKALKLDNIDEATLDKYIKDYDLNGDGEIDYNEFLNLMGKIKKPK